jgi:hypothetical protein
VSKRSAEIPKIVAYLRGHADYCGQRIVELDAELAGASIDPERRQFIVRWRDTYSEKWAVLSVMADNIEAGAHLKGGA